MLRKHLQTIAAMRRRPALVYRIRTYFALPPRVPLYVSLRRRGLGQADLVVCLLRLNSRYSVHFAERLIGKPITRAPACLLRYRTNGGPPRVLRQPRVVWVAPTNPCQRQTDLRLRFDHFQPGRTMEQLLVRGLSRRDIRTAVRRGWVQMSAQ